MKWDDFQPYYNFGVLNSEVEVDRAQASLTLANGTTVSGDFAAVARFLPKPSLEIVGAVPGVHLGLLDSVQQLHFAGKTVDAFPIDTNINSSGSTSIRFCLRRGWHVGKGDETSRLCHGFFHLVNFGSIIGTHHSVERVGKGDRAIQHFTLSAGGWKVDLRSLASTSDTLRELCESGGGGLTHIARFRREDQSTFTGEEAEALLIVLRFFLTFAHGDWMTPVLPVGIDANNAPAWSVWNSPGEYWGKPLSWFDRHACDQLEIAFPKFWDKWSEAGWAETLREVIYWYIRNNDSVGAGVDGGITMTQSAIERLAHQYLVFTPGLMQPDGYGRLAAADRMRLFLGLMNIPLAIPPTLTELLADAKANNWIDGPHAIAAIRNAIVHPEHRSHNKHSGAFYDAWRLGLWYLELSILALTGYDGTYGNRLTPRSVGTVEKVPWAQ